MRSAVQPGAIVDQYGKSPICLLALFTLKQIKFRPIKTTVSMGFLGISAPSIAN